MKQTKKQTRHNYRVTIKGSEDTVIFNKVNRTTAERARKYAISQYPKWPGVKIHSVDVELLPS